MKTTQPILLVKFLSTLVLAGGLMSAQATVFNYSVTLSGPNESPTNNSLGTGFGTVDYDNVAHTLALSVSFSGLSGTTTASHIHAPTVDPFLLTANVATTTPSFAGFPLGVTSGTFANTLDLTLSTSYNPSFVTANGGNTTTAEAALASYIAQGRAYWNIHSTAVGSGEIRGFLIAIPEPSTYALTGLGGVGLALHAWNKRRAKRA